MQTQKTKYITAQYQWLQSESQHILLEAGNGNKIYDLH